MPTDPAALNILFTCIPLGVMVFEGMPLVEIGLGITPFGVMADVSIIPGVVEVVGTLVGADGC